LGVSGLASFTIKLKGDTSIVFKDIIDLTEEQIALILSQAETKTAEEWIDPETKGIKIRLTPGQKADVLACKNSLVDGHTAQTLRDSNRIRFTDHGLKRIALRIDGGAPFPRLKSLTGMVDLVINSTKLAKNAEWRGNGSLSYNFTGEYDGKACTVSIVFEGPMLIITVTTDEPSPATARLDALIPAEKWTKIRAMVSETKPKRRK
jgi:hypothetical protein